MLIPGASFEYIERAVELADRVSLNLEAPNQARLTDLAPDKEFAGNMWGRMAWAAELMKRARQAANYDDHNIKHISIRFGIRYNIDLVRICPLKSTSCSFVIIPLENTMRHFARFILSALLLFSFLLTPALPVLAASTRLVSTTGSDSGDCTASPCATIAYAYTQSVTDDTISVAAGTYTETSGYDITKNITISGAGAMSTIVQAATSAGIATHRFYKVNSSGITVNIQNLTLRYGVEASGGALNVAAGTLNLTNVVVSDNQVNNSLGTGLNGGAISVNGGTANITNSAITNNSVTTSDTTSNVRGSGGGIFLGSTGTVTLNNSTVSGNSAIRGGGGLFSNGGTININYSTIANNTSNSADGIAYTSLDGGGINRNGAGTINLKSSIVAGNEKGVSSPSDNDCNGTISSQGYNLTGSSTGCSLAGTGDTAVTPSTVFTSVLGSLADNGGQTYTHALIVGGAAVDIIPSGTNSCGSSPFDYDQRGGTRPYNSNCDMGAYELKTVQSVSTTGTDSGDCTITDCLTLTYAYSKSQAGNTISVAAGTYTETSGYDITKNITISGAGAMSTIVQAATSAGIATHRFYKVNSSGITVNIQNLTLRYGVEASGGALNVGAGTLNLTNVVVSDNQVNNSLGTGLNGGAISVNGGTLTINNSTISNNSVTTSDTTSSVRGSGGGIFLGSAGTVTLNNSTVSGNSAIRGGGGLFSNGGTININYSTIANNTSNSADGIAYTSLDGGGINRNGAGPINLKSSIVAGNKKGVSSPSDNDCNGTITSQGYNLTGSSTGCSLAGTGDVTVSPATAFTSVLGSLANNGGSTYTHLLYGGNEAVDAIPNGTNSCGSGSFAADQRGNTRPYNTSCDMGAYESQDAAPTVSMTSAAGNPTNTSPIPVTVTFSESVTGFTSGDITPGNATVSNFSGSGASYSFDLVPSGDGTVTADIAAGVAQDSVYNYNTAATQFSRSYDSTAPTVSMSSTASNPTNTSPIPVTVTFSESVTGFTDTDITAGNGTVSNFAGSGTTYTFDLTPSSNGTVTANSAAGVAQDAAGNGNSAAAQFSRTYDATAPTVASIMRDAGSTNPTNANSVTYLVGFSESVTGVNTNGFALTTTGTISGASVTGASQFASVLWTVTVNTGSGDGTIRLNLIDDDTIADAAGNKLGGTGTGNGDFTSGETYTLDRTSPAVVLSSTTNDPTTTSPIPVTVTFSESVNGFTSSDITPGNATISNFVGSDTSYSFNLTPSGNGLVTADIAAGIAQDSAGNGNTAATQFSRTYDGTAPTVTSFTATSPSASLNIPITAFAASDASGVTGYLITESATPPSAGAAGWAGSAPATYAVADDGAYTLYPWAKDAAGNVSAVYGSPASVTVETTAPSVVSSVRANTSPTNATSVDFIVTFSEPVSGVDAGDFSLVTGSGLTGASITGVSGGPKVYTIRVNTGSGSGTLRLDVLDNDSITDTASNPLGGSGSANGNFPTGELYTIDKTAPTAGSLVAPNVTIGGGTTYSFTVVFSDNLAIDSTSLDGNDIRVTGPDGFSQLATLIGVTPSGNGVPRTATYQITTPGGAWDTLYNGTYTIAVETNQIFDTAGNPVGATSLGSFLVSLGYTVYLPLVQR